MEGSNEGPDETSVRPVSSLRSKFESLSKDREASQSQTLPGGQRKTSLDVSNSVWNASGTISGSSDPTTEQPATSNVALGPPVSRRRQPLVPRPRPHSMLSTAASQYPPPVFTVNPPSSPPRAVAEAFASGPSPLLTGGSPSKPHVRAHSVISTPGLEPHFTNLTQTAEPSNVWLAGGGPRLPAAQLKPGPEADSSLSANRTSKPKVPSKPFGLSKNINVLSAPEPAPEISDQSISPFNTPPSSGASSPRELPKKTALRNRVSSDASWVQRSRGDSEVSMTDRTSVRSQVSPFETTLLEGTILPPPTHHAVAAKREQPSRGDMAASFTSSLRDLRPRDVNTAEDGSEVPPRLPARPELQTRAMNAEPAKIRSGRVSPARARDACPVGSASDPRKSDAATSQLSGSSSSVKQHRHAAITQGFDRSSLASASSGPRTVAPAIPAPRRSQDRRRELPSAASTATKGQSVPQDADQDQKEEPDAQGKLDIGGNHSLELSDFPDSSSASRKPPRPRQKPWQISTDYDTRLLAVCSEYVCTTGYITKAWSLRTGEQVLNMAHLETVKMTAIVFKPAGNTAEEGERLWLGTSTGEILELDIPSQSVVRTSQKAHRGREIIKIHRYASELWTLDNGGDLIVWRDDHKGYPSLDSLCITRRVAKGPTHSIACERQLWIANGKDIRVYAPTARTDSEFYLTQSPLSQPKAGDVTSGAILSSRPGSIFFGHTDGKVSIYNRGSLTCMGVVSVSLYKITSLAGVGEHLWAGYGTGMTYVYDTSTTPWMTKKDWQAHDKLICGIAVDSSATWQSDRLQVITLGTDNMLRLWDGLLEEDWLESRMQQRDSDYCDFQEITVSVLTWNAGASKPSQLQARKEDDSFFRDYLGSGKLPDMFVFGFQELVDLEDKKLTAKTLFKTKKKDSFEQEHMSHQYRAWRDHLSRCLQDQVSDSEPYTVLHSASMIGLFTCVCVKTSLRPRIKHVHQAEVKRGMGGRYGNKGALVLRMVVDDSSVCLLNCHLAAGQTQTANRNNDIAAILEADALPRYPLGSERVAHHSDVFASGGDGSMILDHELCILNGDLNYRIDTMGRDTVVKHVQQRNLARLLERDQLLLSRKKNPGFRLRAFNENQITFEPTYKYNVGSDEYDTSEKRRAPAWCDRILYRGLGKIKCEEYRRWEVRVSDHRPVSARLRCRIKTVDPERRERVWQKCLEDFKVHKQRVWESVR